MNYRHIYHAGNFADVFKHWLYCLLLDYTTQKDKPFSVLETHAGLGCYSLASIEANKTQEYQHGILKLLQQSHVPTSFEKYLSIVKEINTTSRYPETSSFNDNAAIALYPGSPLLVKQFLRENDDSHLCELHPDDFAILKQNFYPDNNIHCHHINGYHGLKAFLPFKQKRGLIFIDPPFEKENEFEQIIKHLKVALQRFRQGIYAIWFPIKDIKIIHRFYQALDSLSVNEMLKVEFIINDLKNINRLNGCGMAIINPTWQLAKTLQEDLPYLLDLFRLSPEGYSRLD